ncbi:hypothetical protein PISMIDRAFT_113345, partial [Pisolithus microcarpus 441]
FTMDNASNNKRCMQELQNLLHAQDVEFGALDHLVMCFPHITHICVTHVLDNFTDADLADSGQAWAHAFPGEEEQEEYLEAVRSDPISRGHDIVRAIHASGLHQDERAQQVPLRVQQRMSSESPPHLGSTVPCFELLMSAWETLGETDVCLRPWTDVGLKWAVEYYQQMDNTRAYVISMFVDPTIRLSWIVNYWEDEYVASAERMLLQLMHEYRQKLPQMPISAQKQGKGSVHTIDSLAAHFGIKDMGTKTQPQPQREVMPDNEYYTYVNGDLWDDGSDPLKFWERKTFPTIFAIAMDYLPHQGRFEVLVFPDNYVK